MIQQMAGWNAQSAAPTMPQTDSYPTEISPALGDNIS